MLEDNQPQGTEPEAATDNQEIHQENPEVMPASNEEVTEEKQDSEPQGNELPEEASERTKANYEKLLENNRKLKEQLESQRQTQNPKGTSVFDEFRPQRGQQDFNQVADANQYQNLNQNQVDNLAQHYIDEEGNVDVNGLNQALLDANRQAQYAAQQAQMAREQIARYEETQQTKETHKEFPQLDSLDERFDKDFYETVVAKMAYNYAKNQDVPYVEVARQVAKHYKGTESPEKIREEAINDYKQSQSQREQGPIEGGRGEARDTQGNLQELRERTRGGDDSALDARLKKLGIL